jgi:epoxyqueuosine reductase
MVVDARQNGGGEELLAQLRTWATECGFSQIGVADVDLTSAEPGFSAWLAAGFHGSMHYMAAHGMKRARPAELIPGTVRVVTARMDYLPRAAPDDWQVAEWRRLATPESAGVSIYARGRDYHKVLRSRLQRLAERIAQAVGPFGHRVFTDSAPVLEVELAARSGIGWRGKHTLTLHRDAGSMFFLGEIYIDFALPLSSPVSDHCGSCAACIAACPTQAIVAPYRLDARRCISYLTIESDDPIPVALRAAIGNRIYGCDDCQLVCPWNKFARRSALPDFDVRGALGDATLLALWAWSEEEFLAGTGGSAIRRIGYARWQRNLAVGLGNALRAARDPAAAQAIESALRARLDGAGEMLAEHIRWALAQASPALPKYATAS